MPFFNVTLPSVTTDPATVAVNVTGCPNTEAASELETVVVVSVGSGPSGVNTSWLVNIPGAEYPPVTNSAPAAPTADPPELISNTPLFFGAEPALLAGGPRKGLRVLGAIEDRAKALMDTLDAGQRAAAILGATAPVDIFTCNDREPDHGSQLNPMALDRQPETFPAAGLSAARMTPRQKELLKVLIDEYLGRMPDDIAQLRSRALAAGFETITFAWIGATRAGDAPKPTARFGCTAGDTRWECIPLGFPYYYRVLGPTFLIEYMNTNGNHSHSVWRDYQNGDFGEDLLRAHYADVPHDGAPPVAPLLARAR